MAQSLNELILEKKDQFQKLDAANGNLLDFNQQCLFARQQIMKNDFTTKVASQNPISLQNAILNIASIGLSLNPASQWAFLVPRAGTICLDISYRGLVKLATDSGAILWAKSELVYEEDTFEWLGSNTAPVHKAQIFDDRGELKGGYCLAKLHDGSVMVETMTADELKKIQSVSKASSGPWKDWTDEMRKKSITKRAYKSWPQTENRERLDRAIEVLHESEGTAYTMEQHEEFHKLVNRGEAFAYWAFAMSIEPEVLKALQSTFEKGKITEGKKKCEAMSGEARTTLEEYSVPLMEAIDASDSQAVTEIMDELPERVKGLMLERLGSEQLEKYTIMMKVLCNDAAPCPPCLKLRNLPKDPDTK